MQNPRGRLAVLDGTSTIEDYLDDAKQPQMAAQVKQEVDLIAKWRRQQRPLKSSEQNAGTKTGDALGISPSFPDLPRTEPTHPKQTSPEIRGESLSKDGCGPYIDDRWRDILSGQGFQPRSETLQVFGVLAKKAKSLRPKSGAAPTRTR